MTGAEDTPFARSLLAGLAERPKRLEPKFFYDQRGSELFEAITKLDAYYPTRTELLILERAAGEIAAPIGSGAVVVEPGAGALQKAGLLLAALDRPAAFAPGDISVDHLRAAAAALSTRFPEVPVLPFALDFDAPFDLPGDVASRGEVVVFFPGSTIGNFDPAGAKELLTRFAGLGDARWLVIGVDLKKDARRLVRAYDDEEGVTAEFNLNILARANRELGADFHLDRFRHVALYDEAAGRIEMHLESLEDQTVRVQGRSFAFAAGERMHTENSYKYSISEFQAVAAAVGWSAAGAWTDPDDLFSVQLFQRASD